MTQHHEQLLKEYRDAITNKDWLAAQGLADALEDLEQRADEGDCGNE